MSTASVERKMHFSFFLQRTITLKHHIIAIIIYWLIDDSSADWGLHDQSQSYYNKYSGVRAITTSIPESELLQQVFRSQSYDNKNSGVRAIVLDFNVFIVIEYLLQ